MYVLGFESSCDETGVAIYDSEKHCVYDETYTQTAHHEKYGGVVPEIASRDHLKKIVPLLKSVLIKANITLQNIHAISYTAGPGLIGALLVGASFARSLAWSLQLPAIPVHHMEGHLLVPLLETPAPTFPFISLLVSGGHTLLIKVNGIGQYQILGDTLDDAVGEAFDKTARLMGLSYPGGAPLAKLAESGNPKKFKFTRPMVNRPGCDFSFSGLKTQVLTEYKKNTHPDAQFKADIAASFQKTIVDTLVVKCKRALQQTKLNQLVVAGGVSANIQLREGLTILMDKLQGKVFFPRPEFTTDNGAMIAFAGFCRRDFPQHDLKIKAQSRWEIDQPIDEWI
jgi:N6-L-threonylcarbamoyladenine synthase